MCFVIVVLFLLGCGFIVVIIMIWVISCGVPAFCCGWLVFRIFLLGCFKYSVCLLFQLVPVILCPFYNNNVKTYPLNFNILFLKTIITPILTYLIIIYIPVLSNLSYKAIPLNY